MGVQTSLRDPVFISFGCVPEVALLDHIVGHIFNFFEKWRHLILYSLSPEWGGFYGLTVGNRHYSQLCVSSGCSSLCLSRQFSWDMWWLLEGDPLHVSRLLSVRLSLQCSALWTPAALGFLNSALSLQLRELAWLSFLPRFVDSKLAKLNLG